MNILIDIGHPAHVHLFKNFAKEMQGRGHNVLFTCRDKEFEIELLKLNGFDYCSFGEKYTTFFGKLWGLLKFDFKELCIALKFRPDFFMSHGSIYASHAAWLMGVPHVAFEDTYNFEQIKMYKPFTKVILTASYEHPLSKDKKNISYKGFNELAYLYPKKFYPNDDILDELGVGVDDKYVVVRFVAWNATHDFGHKGITMENKIKAVKEFSKYAKVFISSEKELPLELEQYRLRIAPHRMHDVLAYSSLLFGESSTMTEEAAMLGRPSIFLNDKGTIYTDYLQEKYGLCFNYTESLEDQGIAIEKAVELLKQEKSVLCEEWEQKRDVMLKDHIDVTDFTVWFIENYPKSAKIMKENPNYQDRFR